jgi:hypothetical protein
MIPWRIVSLASWRARCYTPYWLKVEHIPFYFFNSMDEMMMKKEGGQMCGPGGCGPGGGCKCPHHKFPAILIVLFGLLFLLKALGYASAATADLAWPILVLLLGLLKLTAGKCKCGCKC